MQGKASGWGGARVLLAVAALGFGAPLPGRAAPSLPQGVYQREEIIPGPERTAGVITYTVDLRRSDRTHVGWIRYEGYQNPGTGLKCRVRPRSAGLDLLFLSYEDGATKNRYGVRQYAPSARLATVRSAKQRGKAGVLLFWHALLPPEGRARPRGTFFERTRG